MNATREGGRGFLIGSAIGVPLIAVGVVGMLQHLRSTPPSSFLRFFVGGDLVHDFVVAPLACAVGVLVVRHAPSAVRPPLRAALFASAIVVAMAWPALRGYGRARTPDNPTVQPLDYATAVTTVVIVIWSLAALWLVVRLVRRRST